MCYRSSTLGQLLFLKSEKTTYQMKQGTQTLLLVALQHLTKSKTTWLIKQVYQLSNIRDNSGIFKNQAILTSKRKLWSCFPICSLETWILPNSSLLHHLRSGGIKGQASLTGNMPIYVAGTKVLHQSRHSFLTRKKK